VPEVKFGPYTLVRRIAVGGMAEVFLARPEKPGWDDHVVVKQILPQLAEEPELLQLFFDEARIASRIFHPGIIRILDVGEHDGVHFLAMEFVDGLDLSQLMKLTRDESGGKPIPLGCAIRVAIDLSRAVHFAHEAREPDGTPLEIVHRDVSPQNVLISKNGDVKLGDFGIARATIRAKRTQTGILRGKIAYVSPEQYLGQRGDRRVDIYAIGIVLYEMIAGRRPFMGEEAQVIQEVMTKHAPPLTTFVPGIDRRLSEVIERAVARSPEERWPTADAFASALERLGIDDDQEALAGLARRAIAYRERKSSEEKEKAAAQKPRATMTLPNPSDILAAQALPRPEVQISEGPRPTETLLGALAPRVGIETEIGAAQARADPANDPMPPTVAMGMPVSVSADEFLPEPATVMRSAPISSATIPRPISRLSIAASIMIVGLLSGWVLSSLRSEDGEAALRGAKIEAPSPAPEVGKALAPLPETASVAAADDPSEEPSTAEPEGDAEDEDKVASDPSPVKKAGDEPRARKPGKRRRSLRRTPPLPLRAPVASGKMSVHADRPLIAEADVPKGEGELSLDSDPWSYVFIGKRELGVTPLAHIKVPAGKQKVRLENPERGISRTITIEIEANKPQAVRVDLAAGKLMRR
jgi:eukaryotic-like serine/threonine-protein kinase